MKELGERLAACRCFKPVARMVDVEGDRIVYVEGAKIVLQDADDSSIVFPTDVCAFTPNLEDEATLWLTIAQIAKLRAGIGVCFNANGANVATGASDPWGGWVSETRDTLAEAVVAVMEEVSRDAR